MSKVSSKRQITIPVQLCAEAHISPGDEVETFIFNGHITIVKKELGTAKGILEHVHANAEMTDEESLLSALEERQKGAA